MRDDQQRLEDILEAIKRINQRTAGARESFATNELLQVWVVHHLGIIGEAARALSDETKGLMSSVPWREIIGMRNILVHEYFGIDLDVVWNVVENHLPALRTAIERHLA